MTKPSQDEKHFTTSYPDLLLKPIFLLSVFLLALNDGYLKSHWPSGLTGKLSDFAGLFFAPVLLVTALDWTTRNFLKTPGISKPTVQASYLCTGSIFASAQLFGWAGQLYLTIFSINRFLPSWGNDIHLTQDPTDLIALSALAISYRWQSRLTSKVASPTRR